MENFQKTIFELEKVQISYKLLLHNPALKCLLQQVQNGFMC
jgi:hypothetical protein